MTKLEPGVYDRLVDRNLRQRLDDLAAHRLSADVQSVQSAELPDRIAEVVAGWVRDAIAAVGTDDRPAFAFELATAVLSTLLAEDADAIAEQQRLTEPIQRLAAVERLAPTNEPIQIRRPLTPLRDTVLMTNAKDQPAVGKELEAEIDSADRIDLVLAFIRWTGVRNLLPHLRRHVEAGKSLRIITTTYTGSTELRALEALLDVGAELRVSYDTSTTRLHAKAWLFQRSNGFSTVYIGSSNLTHSAQITGLEWNVRASQRLNPELTAAFERTFSTYWADPHFELFDRQRFVTATATAESDDRIVTPFNVEPYPFQKQILERLVVERRKGHPHNLIAAATGTGKTIIAALDYRRLRTELDRSRLLFVAHRSEILKQSQATFRHVLRDGAFGELWVDGSRPTRWDNVFASIQSINVNDATSLDPDQFDVVIVDEFHHSAATSYRALLDHLRPRHLLGLTATPERSDGLDVLRWFGGRIAVELRIWDALEQGLLSPFHYFGVHDSTDLRDVTWRRGKGYDSAELTNIYTGDDIWASKVIEAVSQKVGDPQNMRGLGFCVSIDHANFMADCFNRAGIAAEAVTSRTSTADRIQARSSLQDGKLKVLFTVDLFNEGIDIPTIDVVLMLRPTESATIFMQQLGRGLRRADGKDVLTVLDFVGHQAHEFRFDMRFRRMLGRSRREVETDVAGGFPYLPAGCLIELDEVARDIVLKNIREALPTTWRQRVQELRDLGDVPIDTYLHETGLELEDIYRGNRTWTELRRHAGIEHEEQPLGEKKTGHGIARLLHIDDEERIQALSTLISRDRPPASGSLDTAMKRRLQGLLLTVLNPRKNSYASLDEAMFDFWRYRSLRRELLEVLPLLEQRIVHLHQPMDISDDVPLQVHASYTREEILAAFGASTVTKPLPLQTGVFWNRPHHTDLLFVTLKKADTDYSPTTRYLDYAISDRLFHWESQAKDTVSSERGQHYIHHKELGRNIALFVRATKRDTTGRTSAYFNVGTASYVSHQSERPIQITWELHHPLPGDVFIDYRAAVA